MLKTKLAGVSVLLAQAAEMIADMTAEENKEQREAGMSSTFAKIYGGPGAQTSAALPPLTAGDYAEEFERERQRALCIHLPGADRALRMDIPPHMAEGIVALLRGIAGQEVGFPVTVKEAFNAGWITNAAHTSGDYLISCMETDFLDYQARGVDFFAEGWKEALGRGADAYEPKASGTRQVGEIEGYASELSQIDESIRARRAAKAVDQEPVAWQVKGSDGTWRYVDLPQTARAAGMEVRPLYAYPVATTDTITDGVAAWWLDYMQGNIRLTADETDMRLACKHAGAKATPLYRHLAPQEPTGAEVMRLALQDLLRRDEINTCQHDETHRGGAIWEICDSCGRKWADDQGGKPEWVDPPEWIAARAALRAQSAPEGPEHNETQKAVPDHCNVPGMWEATWPWSDREQLAGEVFDTTGKDGPVEIGSLHKGRSTYAIRLHLDSDGDGLADEEAILFFDNHEEAQTYLDEANRPAPTPPQTDK